MFHHRFGPYSRHLPSIGQLTMEGIKWGSDDERLRKIQNDIRRDMEASPCLKGRVKDGGRFGFKIFGLRAERGLRAEGAAFI